MDGPRDRSKHEGLAPVISALSRLRARARATLVIQRAFFIAVVAVLAALGLVGLDYGLRFPQWIRSGHLVVGAIALLVFIAKLLVPAVRFRPSLTSLALRIERERPDLAGSLASAVEFSRPAPDESETQRGLERVVIDRAAAAFSSAKPRSLLRHSALLRRAAELAALAALIVAGAAYRPDLARIGAARLFAPWSDAQWPKRTGIVDATPVAVHPRGAALPLRAAVIKSNRDLDTTYAAAQYRLLDADARPVSATRTALLTHQRREIALAGGRQGALFERLIEADAPFIEYRFVTRDDSTDWRRIRVVDPPAVRAAHAKITPPDYARALAPTSGASALASVVEADLGAGADERAVASPALAGSAIELTLTLNKPVPAKPEDPQWLTRTFGADAAALGPSFVANGAQWTLRFTLADSLRIPISLLDDTDIASVDESSFRFDAVADHEPSVSITEPPADLAVLPTASLTVTGEGRDEVALASVWVEQQVARPLGARQPSGPGGALEPLGEPAELVRTDAAAQRAARASATLTLADLKAKPGDEVWLTAVATDALGASIPAGEPGSRPPTRSALRKLRVISEAELIEEIRAELNAVRQTAIRIDAQQGEVADQTVARGSDRRTRAGQSQIGDRLARQRESIQRLQERVQRNGLEDERLNAMLTGASSATQRAGEASGQASKSLEQAGAEAKASDPQKPDAANAAVPLEEKQAAEVAQDQQKVRDELASLIEALDAGQDSFVVRRHIERLLREQNENHETTRAAAAATAGLSPEQLNADQRAELQRIADKQNELADQARKLTEELPQRAEQVRKQDPAAAAGMEQAARSARNNQVAQKMDQAGEQARQNQTGDSSRTQQQVADALKDMLQDLDKGEKSRQEQLRRQLASLIASIEALVAAQNTELGRLDAAIAPEAPQPPSIAGLDAGMIALNRNTAGVLDQAQAAGREVAPVARLLARASTAQVAAITSLRGAKSEAAHEGESDSLARLKEALAQAHEIDDQQEQAQKEQKKAELRRAYGLLLQRQTAARDQAVPFAALDQPSRRDRASIRAIGEEQVSIREALATLLRDSRDLSDAAIFEFAHRRLDAATGSAADSLRAGLVPPALPQQERAIKGIRDILAAFADANKKKDFNDGPDGGSSGGAGQSGQEKVIPPIAQLRLLRALQGDVAQDTRMASESRAVADLEHIAADQKELADRAAALLDELANRQKKNAKPTDAPQPPEEPNPDDLNREQKPEDAPEPQPEPQPEATP